MALAEARPISLALDSGAARHSFARIADVAPIPNLIKVQHDSFDWFLNVGLKELFAEISPIQDFTGRNMDLELAVPGPDPSEPGYSFGQPKMNQQRMWFMPTAAYSASLAATVSGVPIRAMLRRMSSADLPK